MHMSFLYLCFSVFSCGGDKIWRMLFATFVEGAIKNGTSGVQRRLIIANRFSLNWHLDSATPPNYGKFFRLRARRPLFHRNK